MNESTKTKKALRGSLFALFLCIVLLIGTTFAWFTDSVTSGMNQIKSGNLKVGLQYSHDGGTNWKTVTENTDDIFAKDALWEPGHVEYANLKVANLGTLALKYQLGINIGDETPGTNVAGEQFKLSDYLNIAVVDGANTYATRADALAAAADGVALTNYTKTGELTPASADKSNEAVTVIVYMPETVGNEANYKTGTEAPTIDLGVKLTATQTPYENDSFDNQYDKNAASFDELKDAFANGGTIKVSKDINTNNSDDTANARMIISKKTTLNLDAKIISPDNMGNNNTNFCALIVDADTTINASDNGGIDTGKNGGYALNVRNGVGVVEVQCQSVVQRQIPTVFYGEIFIRHRTRLPVDRLAVCIRKEKRVLLNFFRLCYLLIGMQKLHVQLAGRDGVSAAADAVGEPCESTSSHHQHAEQQRTRTYKKSFFRCTAPFHIRISFCLFSEIKRHTILFSVPFDSRPPKGGWKHENL